MFNADITITITFLNEYFADYGIIAITSRNCNIPVMTIQVDTIEALAKIRELECAGYKRKVTENVANKNIKVISISTLE